MVRKILKHIKRPEAIGIQTVPRINISACEEFAASTRFTQWLDESGWMSASNLVSSNNKDVANIYVYNIKYDCVGHAEVGLKPSKFETNQFESG